MVATRSMLRELTEGVHVAGAPVSIVGMPLETTMTVLGTGEGELLLHSPIPRSPELAAAVDALGRVTRLHAPNTFHHLSVGEWAGAYPDATLAAPPGLARKRPDLHVDSPQGGETRRLAPGVLEIPIRGFRLEESVLFHEASRTLVVADLVHNVGAPRHAWTRFYTRLMGFHDRVALSRMIRWTGFSDRRAARESVDEILGLDFERVVVGHGAPILVDAKETLTVATAWLRA